MSSILNNGEVFIIIYIELILLGKDFELFLVSKKQVYTKVIRGLLIDLFKPFNKVMQEV